MRPRSATSVPSTAHDSLSMMQYFPHLQLGAYKCFITNAIWRRIMLTTKTAVHDARDQAINFPVRLSVLAISRSVEDLAFLEDRFKEARWKLYIARTY